MVVNQYLQTDDLVPWLGVFFRWIVSFLPELLPGPSFALSHGVDGLQVRWVGQHSHMKRVSSSEIQLHRGGEVGEDITDGRRGVGELAEATHLTEHELEKETLWEQCCWLPQCKINSPTYQDMNNWENILYIKLNIKCKTHGLFLWRLFFFFNCALALWEKPQSFSTCFLKPTLLAV